MKTKLQNNRVAGLLLVAFVMALASLSAMAGTDATVITTSASTAFADIATLCVAIGSFFVIYRLVQRIH